MCNCICFNVGQTISFPTVTLVIFYTGANSLPLTVLSPTEGHRIPYLRFSEVKDSEETDSLTYHGNRLHWADYGGVTTTSSHNSVYYLSNNEKENYSCEAIRVFGRTLVILFLNHSYPTPSIDIATKDIYKKSQRNINLCITQNWSPQSRRVYMDACPQYVVAVDSCSQLLYCFDYHGTCILQARLHSMHRPLGIHITRKNTNHVVVTDNTQHSITKFSLNFEYCNVQPVWTCKGIGQPTGITSDEDGILYVASDDGSLSFVSPEGKSLVHQVGYYLKASRCSAHSFYLLSYLHTRLLLDIGKELNNFSV